MSSIEKKTKAKTGTIVDNAVIVEDPAIKNVVALLGEAKYAEAIVWIQRKAKEEEQYVRITTVFNAYPSDGAVSFYQVLKEEYGWVEQVGHEGFWGTTPPTMLTVETVHGPVEVPWGVVRVPNIEGPFTLYSAMKDGMHKFAVMAEVKQKHRPRARRLMDLMTAHIKTHSIYKGQSVSLQWEEESPSMFTPGSAGFGTPKFITPSGMGTMDLILPEEVGQEVDATIFSLIENHDKAIAMGIPSKRLILLAGPYGVGKTLTATITAEVCRKVGRTFAYLKDIEHLHDAVYFLQNYSPACVFGEDIDSVEAERIDEIANTIDGLDTKLVDIIFILTTNHPDRIPEKFLRPGRSDMVIRFTAPDAEAAARLVLRYGGQNLDCTYDEALKIGQEMASVEMIPASIREVVDRSKLFALREDRDVVNASDIRRANRSIIQQLALLKRKPLDTIPEHLEELGMVVRNKNGKTFVSR